MASNTPMELIGERLEIVPDALSLIHSQADDGGVIPNAGHVIITASDEAGSVADSPPEFASVFIPVTAIEVSEDTEPPSSKIPPSIQRMVDRTKLILAGSDGDESGSCASSSSSSSRDPETPRVLHVPGTRPPAAGALPKRFACTFCEYRAKWKANVLNHVKTVHLGIREVKLKCSECDYRCRYKSQLAQHVSAIHEKLKPFQCGECGYTCSQKSSLNLHLRSVHQQLKRFACDVCDYRTGTRYGLKKHLEGKHDVHKMLVCYECDFVASTEEAYEVHLSDAHAASPHHLTPTEVSTAPSTVFVGTNVTEEQSQLWDQILR